MAFSDEFGFVETGSEALLAQNAELGWRVQVLEESLTEATTSMLQLRAEDVGWKIIGQVTKEGDWTAQRVREIAKRAEEQAISNPLLKRAFELRRDPIWSRGFELQGGTDAFDGNGKLKPRFQKKVDDASVQRILFEPEGLEANEQLCYNTGNLFLAYNRGTGKLIRIPFEQITNTARDPEDESVIAYYLREYTVNGFAGNQEKKVEWYPTVDWKDAGLDTIDEIAKSKVNHDWQIIDFKVNVPSSGLWGLPDVITALPFAWAYVEYIRDAASVVKALQTIAWRIVGKTKAQAQAAGVQMAGARRAGGVAATTEGTTFEAVPKSGQVNMADGVMMAAMVASATGVSTNALISSSTGGTSAAVQSLDGPTVAMARSRQERWAHFYKRVFKAMGIPGLTINFPKITEDPIYRVINSLATVRATGGLWADEYRTAVLEALSLSPLHDEAPEVTEYAQAQNALGFIKQMTDAQAADDAANDPLARQGNTGVAGSGDSADNSIRDADNAAASQTQTDLT